MSKISEKRMMYAKVLTENGVDLTKSYYAQPDSQLRVVFKSCEIFKFKSTNPCRTNAEQFYYAAQAGFKLLNK